MKKIYKTPILMVTPLRPSSVVATSIKVKSERGQGHVLIKEENTKTYNIWDDDWNK